MYAPFGLDSSNVAESYQNMLRLYEVLTTKKEGGILNMVYNDAQSA